MTKKYPAILRILPPVNTFDVASKDIKKKKIILNTSNQRKSINIRQIRKEKSLLGPSIMIVAIHGAFL